MLPSMPILFSRESQDAFGNKIEPSTSYFHQSYFQKPPLPEPPPPPTVPDPPKPPPKKETKGKGTGKKKTEVKETPPKINNAMEAALVKNYFSKVQSRFSPHLNSKTNKFKMFEAMLKSYDPSKETPVELYKKIEDLFGEEHKDLVEEFLLFLKPAQAVQVGRFMDHFTLVQMRGFIELLHSTYGRKPTVLRKIIRALTAGINSGSAQELRSRVLPQLRSNPRLIHMFKSLIPDERVPDSWYESDVEVLNENFLTNDNMCETWDIEEPNDNKKKLDATDRLSTTYLHGRVFLQHGRNLRPARVTFPYSKEPYRVHARRLAPNQPHPSPPQSDDEPSPKRPTKPTPKIATKKNKKSKSPAKKDVNDNTNKDINPKTVQKKTKTTKKDDKESAQKKKVETKMKKDEIKEVKEVKNVVVKLEVDKDKKPEIKGNWTREEDKTMLQVLKGEAGSEEIFGKIRELLPHKSVSEIKERFCHVMNLLQQMAVEEVT